MTAGGLRIGADVGGTFTDVLAHADEGGTTIRKVLSTPPRYDEAVVEAVRGVARNGDDGAARVAQIVHGTTVATNAVLQRRGSRVALVTTEGFRDVLELRRLRTPHMYDWRWRKPATLVERRLRFELPERVQANGQVLAAPAHGDMEALVDRLMAERVEAIAICFLHSYRYPDHERLVGAFLAARLPGVAVSLSSDIMREQGEYERTATTVVNAYVRPLMAGYLSRIRTGLEASGISAPLMIMQSSGGVMTDADAGLRPVLALESGPAAGAIATAGIARLMGYEDAIAFDMGGTTAKASLIEGGRVSRGREYEVGGDMSAGSRLIRGSGELLRIPTIDIAEVGAGGGSIAWIDGAGGLHVGPNSAGADPGPACYGLGGREATVTDANVVLGYMREGSIGDGGLSISRALAEKAVDAVAGELGMSLVEAAHGVQELANARMMRALRAVSSERGRDPRRFVLVAYGGAGPIHAAGLAADLGVQTVIVPPLAGIFSAVGLLFAKPEFHDVRTCDITANTTDPDAVGSLIREMAAAAAPGVADWPNPEFKASADLRYLGQSWELEVELASNEPDRGSIRDLIHRFEDEHERLYGVRGHPDTPIQIRAVRLVASAETGAPQRMGRGLGADLRMQDAGSRPTHRRIWLESGEAEVAIRTRASIGTQREAGPHLIDEYDTTVVVPPGWTVRRDETTNCLVLEQLEVEAGSIGTNVDPVTLQLVDNALSAVADERRLIVFRTAHSTTVRDSMDFSTSICDPTGQQVAQAVTVPFHLGAVPEAIRTLQEQYGDSLVPGDVFIMNDPFGGGMHTPDIFVFRPVFTGGTLIGFACTTAHHADVGGRMPGSAATDNTEIYQEGLRLPWVRLYAGGEVVEDVVKVIRTNVRIPDMTMGDIFAQVAACEAGAAGLTELAERHGTEDLATIMSALLDYTERLVRSELTSWPDGTASFTDYLDSDGIDTIEVPITVHVTIQGDSHRRRLLGLRPDGRAER